MSGAASLTRAKSSKAAPAAQAVSAPDAPMPPPTPDQIIDARTRAGLTQRECAALAGYSTQVRWAEIEAGRVAMPGWRWEYFLHRAGIRAMPFTG